MIEIKLPKTQVLVGGPLNEIANYLNMFGNIADRTPANGDLVYKIKDQSEFEDILTHENIMKIAEYGGDVKGYLMYAAMPFELELDSVNNAGVMTPISQVEVPVGLELRSIKVSTGIKTIEVVKNLAQWASSYLAQKFSQDFKTVYVQTIPLGKHLSAKELKIFVDAFAAVLITVKEFDKKVLNGEIV